MQKYPENILKEIPIFSYDSTLLLESLSNYLTTSNYIKPIKDQDILKLGVAKEIPPSNENWIYVRAASIFRTLCLQTMQNKDTSLRFFSKKYNSRQNRGCRPSRFARGGVAHLKHIIECFKENKLVEENDGKYKMTKEGLDMMKNFLEKMME